MGTLKLVLGLVTVLAVVSCSNAEDDSRKPRTCPLIKCLAMYPPCFTYKKDDRGCQTCHCLHQCPHLIWPTNCRYGVENFLDRLGCPSCRCKHPPPCRTNTACRLYCKHGFKKNSLGCDICECKSCGCSRNMNCPYGKLVDDDDCFLCECKPKPECGRVCKIFCPKGRVLDKNGCPTCKCKPHCGPVCDIYCEHGNVLDEKGCKTCKCKPKPDDRELECKNYCKDGRESDDKGHPTCKCKPSTKNED